MEKLKEFFLHIIRLGINKEISGLGKCVSLEQIDWEELYGLASRQGLLAIVMDGMELLPDEVRPPKKVRLQWIGEVLQNYEARYDDYRTKIGQLADFYHSHGFKLMVLKGYGLSLNYPKPSHRPCGDIDIWLFGQQEEADAALAASSKFQGSGSKIDKSHHHHTVFEWNGYMVENHYDFVNVHYGHKNVELEKVFKELAKDDSNVIEIDGHPLYLPSVNLHALFLLRHCMQDFAAAEMSMRQVLDWGFFIENHSSEIDWEWFLDVLEEFKMSDFYNIISAICVEDLGFTSSVFNPVSLKSVEKLEFKVLKKQVLNEVLEPSFSRKEPMDILSRLIYKFRRWRGNAWKQQLCYDDSRWNAFWNGVWNHLLKPNSI